MRTQTEAPLLFCSYARPDRERVIAYYDHLVSNGFNVWIDCRHLVAGQDWNREIKRALEKSTIILFFMSTVSVNRRGYVQKELKLALDKCQEKLVGDIFLVPILLDELPELPDGVKALQCVRTWEGDPRRDIEEAVRHQLTAIGAQLQQVQDSSQVAWSKNVVRETWDGLPGYESEVSFLNLSSSKYAEISGVSDYLRGKLVAMLMEQRQVKFFQTPNNYNFGQDRYLRSHTLDAHCSDPTIAGRVLTVQYAIYTFSLGAHGYTSFITESFTLDPVTRVSSIKSIFHDPEGALTVIRNSVRASLLTAASETNSNEPPCGDREWVHRGTEDWDAYSCSIYEKHGIEFIFPQYQVDSYAAGVKRAVVKYEEFRQFIEPSFLSALDIDAWRIPVSFERSV